MASVENPRCRRRPRNGSQSIGQAPYQAVRCPGNLKQPESVGCIVSAEKRKSGYRTEGETGSQWAPALLFAGVAATRRSLRSRGVSTPSERRSVPAACTALLRVCWTGRTSSMDVGPGVERQEQDESEDPEYYRTKGEKQERTDPMSVVTLGRPVLATNRMLADLHSDPARGPDVNIPPRHTRSGSGRADRGDGPTRVVHK